MSNAAVIEAVLHTPVGGAGATTVVAACPGGGKVGKTLVALISWRGIGVVTPAEGGWTERYNFPDTLGPQLALFTRPSTDAEPATYTFNFSGSAARVVPSLFFISNSINGIEAFSAEASGLSQIAIPPSVVSPGDGRTCLRIVNKANVNNMVVPANLKINLRWNTGGSAGGAVGHAMTADVVNAGATVAEQFQIADFVVEWRAVTLIVGPGNTILSKADRLMRELSGFAGSSIADKERKRLQHLILPTVDPNLTISDLYALTKSTGQTDGRNRLI